MPPRLTQKDQKRLTDARSAWNTGRYDEAIRLYERLADRHRNEPTILLPLAQCYVARGHEGPARKLLGRLSEGFRSNGEVMAWVGQVYYQYAQPDEALDALQQALGCGLTTPQQVRVRTTLASTYERLNDLERARPHVTFLQEYAPGAPFTHFMTGLMALRAGEPADAEAFLRRAVAMSAQVPEMKVRALHELGHALDRQGRYDEAWEAFASAKDVVRPGVDRARAQAGWVASVSDGLAAAVRDPAFRGFDSPADGARAARPVLLLTGHPRSGTTLLEQMLDSHGRVVSADETSTLLQQVFQPLVGSMGRALSRSDLCLEQVSVSKATAAREAYLRELAAVTGDIDPSRWLIDKNPEAVVMIPAFQRVMPTGRVVVMVRDPRDVVLSCFTQYLTVNAVSVNYDTIEHTAQKYARTMGLWLAMREHLTVPCVEIRYEDVVTDPEGQARRCLDLMGLPFEDSVLRHHAHVRDKVVRSPTYHAVAKPITTRAVGRWKHYEQHLAPAFETLAPFIEAFGYEG